MISDVLHSIKKHWRGLLFLELTWGIYLGFLFSKAVSWSKTGLDAGHVVIWSDWSLHIGMVNLFATKPMSEWFWTHPIYSGGKFTYPFLTNLISGMLMRMGVPLVPALVVPSVIFVILLVAVLYGFAFLLLRSMRKAVVAIYLFFLSAGVGGFIWIYELARHFQLADLIYPPRDFTKVDEFGWLAGNMVTAMLLPQRGFLLGMVLAATGVITLIRGIEIHAKNRRTAIAYFGVAAFALGILPITHMHSLIAIGPALGIFILSKRKLGRDLLYFLVPCALLTFGLYGIFIRGGIENPHFFSWQPGWEARGSLVRWFKMWWLIWGLTIPLAILVSVRLFQKPSFRIQSFTPYQCFALGFWLLFGIANLILFQPMHWDNSKIFLYCYFGFCILAADFVVSLFETRRKVLKIVSVALMIGLTLSGFTEILRLQNKSRNTFQMIANDEINLAREVQAQTSPRDIFATEPAHNHFIMMWAARPILLGYTAWVLNYGFLYDERERDLNDIYQNKALSEDLLKKYSVNYLVVGPGEKYHFKFDPKYFDCRYPVKFSNASYNIYDVKNPKASAKQCGAG